MHPVLYNKNKCTTPPLHVEIHGGIYQSLLVLSVTLSSIIVILFIGLHMFLLINISSLILAVMVMAHYPGQDVLFFSRFVVGHCFYIILPLHTLSKVFVYVCHIKPLGRAKKSLLQRFMVSAHSHMCWLSAGHVGCLFAQPVGLSTCLKDVLRAPWV